MSLAAQYDALNTALFLPAGGSRRVRRRFVDALAVRPGDKVLELGCGTGQVTALLVDAGAEVVAVDALPGMMAAARNRAPEATFVEGDLFDLDLAGPFDHVVLAFVLHNFDAAGRTEALRRASAVLTPCGRVGILDWAVPPGRLRGRAWRRFLARVEPSRPEAPVDAEREHLAGLAPHVAGVLDGRLDAELPDAGLRVVERRSAANGRAQILVAERSRASIG